MEKVVLEFLRVVEVLYMPTSLHQAGCVHSLGTCFAEICHVMKQKVYKTQSTLSKPIILLLPNARTVV